eukprot:g1599.t1
MWWCGTSTTSRNRRRFYDAWKILVSFFVLGYIFDGNSRAAHAAGGTSEEEAAAIANLYLRSKSSDRKNAANAMMELAELLEFGGDQILAVEEEKDESFNSDGSRSAMSLLTRKEQKIVWYYNQSSRLGNTSAMFTMAILHSTALLNAQRDPAAAIANFHFAAVGGHLGAQRAMGYRYLYGVGVPKNCSLAVAYYELAASAVMSERDAFLPPRLVAFKKIHQQQLSTAHGQKQRSQKRKHLVDYYLSLADGNNPNALLQLGYYHLYGPPLGAGEDDRSVATQDFGLARDYFERALEKAPEGGRTRTAALLALAQIHFRGFGVEANATQAHALWMEVIRKNIDEQGEAHNGLGVLFLDGLTKATPQDLQKAKANFKTAAERGNARATYNLAMLHLQGRADGDDRSFSNAAQYMSLAAQRGLLPAVLRLAQLKLRGLDGAGLGPPGGDGVFVGALHTTSVSKCETAASLFKSIAEKDPWVQWLVHEAYRRFEAGGLTEAVSLYLRAAEQGVVDAQMNAAWIIQKLVDSTRFEGETYYDDAVVERNDVVDAIGGLQASRIRARAMQQEVRRLYSRAAQQGDVQAKLELGDWYYYNRGDAADPNVGVKRSVAYYRSAAASHSAQAQFNLGFMYQFGIGVAHDLHLAKRFYDQSKATDGRAFVPSSLALWGLQLHRAFLEARIAADALVARFAPAWWKEGEGGAEETGNGLAPSRGEI